LVEEKPVIVDGKKEDVLHLSKGVSRRTWARVWFADLLSVLGLFENKQFEVFCYIMEHVNLSENIFIGSFDKIARETGISKSTVCRIIPKLIKADFMVKVQNGVYRINPAILMMGKDTKRHLLISYYVEEKGVQDKDKAKIHYYTNNFDIDVGKKGNLSKKGKEKDD